VKRIATAPKNFPLCEGSRTVCDGVRTKIEKIIPPIQETAASKCRKLFKAEKLILPSSVLFLRIMIVLDDKQMLSIT
jgi:hypothetical protein